MNEEEKQEKHPFLKYIIGPCIAMLICYFAGMATAYGYDLLGINHTTGEIEKAVIVSQTSDDSYYYIYDKRDNEYIIPIDHEKSRIKTDKNVEIGDTVKIKRIDGQWCIVDRK